MNDIVEVLGWQSSAVAEGLARGLGSFAVPEPMTLDEWAGKHFYLSKESSYVEQTWVAWPFQCAIMACISNDDISEVDFMKSARVGYTKMLLAALGYFIQHKRRNQALWQPTDGDSDMFVKTELEPMLRDVRIMRRAFPAHISRHKDNTLQQKKFLGCMLHLRGGKAAKNYRRISVDNALLDELDAFDSDVEKEGDPITLAAKRIEGATFPKLVAGSTPGLKGLSLIEARFDLADARFKYAIPCPDCGEFHALAWGDKKAATGFKWIDGDPDTVRHLCPHCSSLIDQGQYLVAAEKGHWQTENGSLTIDQDGIFFDAAGASIDAPRHVAFHVWTAYSPLVTWSKLVREFMAAHKKTKGGDNTSLKAFTNTTLGETWQEEAEKTEADELLKRAENYPLRTVPMGGLILAAGVDVQSNRFEIMVWAFGRGEEMWVIDYHVIDANPADEREWEEKLDPYLKLRFAHAGGQTLAIEATGIDTGGHYTHQAYNFCRTRARQKIYAIKGDSRQGRPVKGKSSLQDVNFRGAILKRGVKLWMVGTDTAKDLLHGRLMVNDSGPGHVHFSKGLPVEFYEQLTAEVRILQKTAVGEQYRWIKRRQRNEALDCTVYAMFASHMLDLNRYTERMWAKLEDAVCPANGDMFANAAPTGSGIAEAVPLDVASADVCTEALDIIKHELERRLITVPIPAKPKKTYASRLA